MIDESRLSHLDPETRAALAKAVERIVAVADPAKIILFGSAARGDAWKESDLDLLVSIDRRINVLRESMRLYMALYGIGKPVDLIVTTPDGLEKHKDDLGLVYRRALTEGFTCYER